jgi:hypothetical protein
MEVNREERLREGFQLPAGGIFKRSRQMRPSLSMLGWYTGVKKRTLGGSKG